MKYRTSTFVEKMNYLLGKKQNKVLQMKMKTVETKESCCKSNR